MEEKVRRDPEHRALEPGGNPQTHRVSNFYIDHILSADFGRRRKDNNNDEEEEERGLPEKKAHREDPGGAEDRHQDENRTADGRPEKRPTEAGGGSSTPGNLLWPAWVYCTRYSDRPSSGPRSRKGKKPPAAPSPEDKRPRTAFSAAQLQRLKAEFQRQRYLTEPRRQSLAQELDLNESQIKIWFQNKRAKIKKEKEKGNPNSLAQQLMEQGLYDHSTAKTSGSPGSCRSARSDSD